MPMLNSRDLRGPQTATYLYAIADGTLIAWAPDATTPVVASSTILAARSLAMVAGQPPLDATHVWQMNPPGVVVVSNPTSLTVPQFIFLFTPSEMQSIQASVDPIVQQYVTAVKSSQFVNLSDTIVQQGVQYAVSIGLLTSNRAAQILANQPHS